MKKNSVLLFIMVLSLITMLLSLTIQNVTLGIIALTLIFIVNLVYAIFDIKNRYLLIFFLISFFTFTMGQYYFPNNSNELYFTNYENSIIIYTLLMQYISLFSIIVGYFFLEKFLKNKKISFSLNEKIFSNKIIFLIFIIFIICFICSCITYIETGYRVMKYGYLVIYNGLHPTIIPSIISYLGNSTSVFLIILLIICNSKKIIGISLILYFINISLSLLTGVRGTFIIGVLFIIYYLIYYQGKYKYFSKKIIKNFFVMIILVFPIMIIGLNIYNNTRNNLPIEHINVFAEFKSFFVNQGTSVNVISSAQKYEKNLKQSGTTNFVFGPLLYSFQNKVKILTFNHINTNDLYTLENQKKNNLGVSLSILVLGYDRYSKGHGVGSQYIAELYIDYGYLGIIIFNLILGAYMCLIYRLSNHNWLIFGINLLSFSSIVYISRGQVMQLITSIASINFWCVIYFIVLLEILNKRFLKGRK